MKKKVLCAFVLILYLLVCCTILSQKVEDEMKTMVEIDLRTAAGSIHPTYQSRDSLFPDESGMHLYEVLEEDGWQKGLRVEEISEGVWEYAPVFGLPVQVPGGKNYSFVKAASRHPVGGELAEIVESFETGEDQYLLVSSDGISPKFELPETWSISARTENTMLLDVPDGRFPYFQHQAKVLTGLGESQTTQIISLTEVELFLEQLPSVALVAILLLVGLVLCVLSCAAGVRPRRNRWLLLCNGVLAIGTLILLHWVLSGLDFPASLLSNHSILDRQHYADTFPLIFSALEELSGQGQPLFVLRADVFGRVRAVLISGAAGCAALTLVEGAALRRKQRPKRLPCAKGAVTKAA